MEKKLVKNDYVNMKEVNDYAETLIAANDALCSFYKKIDDKDKEDMFVGVGVGISLAYRILTSYFDIKVGKIYAKDAIRLKLIGEFALPLLDPDRLVVENDTTDEKEAGDEVDNATESNEDESEECVKELSEDEVREALVSALMHLIEVE